MGCCKIIIDNCCENALSLKHEPAEDFYKSQWPKEPKNLLWVIFRCCVALYFSIVVPCSMVVYFKHGLWFIYLTDWGFCLCMVTADFGAVLTTLYYCGKARFDGNSIVLKLYWLIYTISIVVAPVVSIVYWVLLYKDSKHNCDWSNISAHALNSIISMTDFLISAMPIRIMHAVYVIVFGLIYASFTLIYHFKGGVNSLGQPFIYPILNWEYPDMAVLCIVLICVIFFVNSTLLFLLSRCRETLARRTNGQAPRPTPTRPNRG